MALIEWNEGFETGHHAVDAQHKHLFSLVNDLNEGLMTGRGKEMMGTTLRAVASYVAEHFRSEEALMAELEYQGSSEHRRKHEELSAQVRLLVADHAAGKLTLPLTLARFLADWLRNHIEEEDMKLVRWIREKG